MLRVVSREKIVIATFDFLEEDTDFFIDADHQSLDDFFSIFGKRFSLLPEEYSNVCNLLGIAGSDRLKAVPMKVMRKVAAGISNDIKSVFSNKENVVYLKRYLKIRSFLDHLKTANVDSLALKTLIEEQEHEGVKTNLRSFENPQPVKYSMANSVTGRLSVVSGPKILTSPQEVKSVFRSRYEGGSILQIDLSCAEPNFALFVAGKKPIRNLYDYCAADVLEGKVDRSTAKLVLLSALYGQSIKNLSANIPDGISASLVAKKVRDFLMISDLLESLRTKWASGNFRNHASRPLDSQQQRLLISHYLQSSVAEASILMFEQFCSRNRVDPIFVIHDALVVDCDSKVAGSLLSSEDPCLEYENQKFPVSITRLG